MSPTAADRLRAMLAAGPVVLDGAVGTELLRRGAATPLPLWSTAPLLEAPDLVREIHRDHVRAGARLVTANTFRADRRTLARAGVTTTAGELVARAVRLAREGVAAAAIDEPVLVAGSVAPVEDCYRPDLVPDEATLAEEHAARAADLAAAGADLALVETMGTVREARVALAACAEARLPALVSFVCGPGAALLSGESLAEAAAAVEGLDPLALLVNCCAPPIATEAVRALVAATARPVGVQANGPGRPDAEQGWTFAGGTTRSAWRAEARRWLAAGARLVGGCCGTDAALIRDVATLVSSVPSDG